MLLYVEYFKVHTSVEILYIIRTLLDANFLLASCPSVCQHTSAWLPLNGFAGNLIIGTFMRSCAEPPNLFKIGQKCGVHYVNA